MRASCRVAPLRTKTPRSWQAAIEVIVAELGDPVAIPLLAKLERDGRQVQLDDDEGGERVSIADLAHEAREILEEMEAEASPPPAARPSKGKR